MTSTSPLGRINADAELLRMRLNTLTRQSASGLKAEQLGDLSPAVPRLLSLRSEATLRDEQSGAIAAALDRASVSRTALSRLGQIAREFGARDAIKLDPNDTAAVPVLANRARAAMIEVGQLLNTRHAGEYLFGGSDLLRPPVPDPEGLPTSGMAAQIATAVASLGGGNAATVATQTRTAASSDAAGVTPFSAFVSDPLRGLTEPRRSVPSDDGQLTPYGLFANRNAVAVSTGETTGSWARDLLRGLASLAALTPAQAASPADFEAFAVTVREGLQSADRTIAQEAGALGQTERRLEETRTRHAEVQTALRRQVADIEEVDLADTLTRLQQTRTALEASYAATARLIGLSLTQFLR